MAGMEELEDLVRKARDGDMEAFRRVWSLTWPRMRRLAGHLCSDPGDADDLLQTSYVQCWKGLAALRDPKAFLGWLRRIVVNRAHDRWRSRRPVESLDAEDAAEPVDGEPLPFDLLETRQRQETVRKAVADLPEGQRAVVALFYLEEMEVLEIASVLGLPKGTVLSRLARGRDALRLLLSPLLMEASR
jgi:RNA polymerase sigma-70 factor, ECF subfamily